ncbi:MAG: GTP-binding protein [Thermodesulfobacteriota bacterium]
MGDKTRVYLITGFLGSGKTTFLNRIIDEFPKNQKLTILMNEFGEIGIDGTLVAGDDIDMMEISKGSIFCVCVKTDFIKGLYELNTKIQPDVLLIESTGVANPSDLKKDLALPIFNNRFEFTEQFCMIDAAHFLDAYQAFASVEKQIASSTVFIINKMDMASPEGIEEIKRIIREYHPDPYFYETTYARIPLKPFRLTRGEEGRDNREAPDPEKDRRVLSTEELDRFIDGLLDSPDLEITPPDQLVSAAYQWSGKDLDQIRNMADSLPSSIIRAKGFVEGEGSVKLFSYVMGDWSIEDVDIPESRISHKNIVVFIGPPESMSGVEEAVKTGTWKSLGILQPYSAK